MVLWPATKERFKGAATYLLMWAGVPRWLAGAGRVRGRRPQRRAVVDRGPVRRPDVVVAQRARVFRGRITTAIDLWTDEGGVLVPSWRTALHDVDGVHAVPPSLPPNPASNEEPS